MMCLLVQIEWSWVFVVCSCVLFCDRLFSKIEIVDDFSSQAKVLYYPSIRLTRKKTMLARVSNGYNY